MQLFPEIKAHILRQEDMDKYVASVRAKDDVRGEKDCGLSACFTKMSFSLGVPPKSPEGSTPQISPFAFR